MSDTTPSASGTSIGRPFNTPLECGFRLLFVLVALEPRSVDLQRLVSYDYLLVHSGDVPGGPESLHPAVPFRGGEWLIRRDTIAAGLDLMFSRELVAKHFNRDGMAFTATQLTKAFLSLLKGEYARSLWARATWIADRFGSYSDTELLQFMTENVGRWGAEFDRLSVLRHLEL